MTDVAVVLGVSADAYLFMHSQPRNCWTFEVDVRPFKESW